MEKILFILTNTYPKSNGSESIFLQDELKEAVKYVDRIYIIPADTDFSSVKTPPPHEKIKFVDLNDYAVSVGTLKTTLFRSKILFKTVAYAIAQKKSGFLSKTSLSYEFAYLKKIAALQSRFATFLNGLENGQFYAYSYWFDIWPLILSKASIKNKFVRTISRAHGFDIFPEQQKHRFDPYFKIKYKNVDLVSSVSLRGKSSLKAKVAATDTKIIHGNLGVSRNIQHYIPVQEGPLLIVSCSIMTELKRVFLIPAILEHLTVEYKWIHFGDGSPDEISVVRKAIEKYKVNGELKGYISNSDLMQFYREHHVNLFINVSSSEGIPFSMMEAMSFGIPCMATHVGGNSEIVDESNGFLIPAEFNLETVANAINNMSVETQNSKREQAFKRWEEKFNAEKNYKAFYGLLIGSN